MRIQQGVQAVVLLLCAEGLLRLIVFPLMQSRAELLQWIADTEGGVEPELLARTTNELWYLPYFILLVRALEIVTLIAPFIYGPFRIVGMAEQEEKGGRQCFEA